MHSQTFQLPVGSFHVRPVQRNVFQPVLQFYDIDQRFSVFLLVFLINIKILAGIIYVFPGETLLLQKFTLERIQIQENIIMLFDMLFINDPDQFFQIFSIRQDCQDSRQDHQFIHDLFKNIPV